MVPAMQRHPKAFGRAFGLLLLGSLACVSAPERRDPLAGAGPVGPPAYPDVTLGLVLSENTKNALAYGREGAKHADFDPDQEFDKTLGVYRRNFESTSQHETLEAAMRSGVELVALVDDFAEVGTSVDIEYGAIFFTPQGKKLAELRGRAEQMIGLSDPGEVVVAVGAEARQKLEQAIRGSSELAQHARAHAPVAASEPAPLPALRVATRMIVLPLKPVGDVQPDLCRLLTSLLLTHLSSVKGLTTIGEADFEAMLGVERRKDLLGCTDASCMAEIGGALGADLILHGEVGTLGSSYNLNLSVVRAASSTVATRASRVTPKSEEGLGKELVAVVREIAEALNAGSTTPAP